MEEFIKKMPCYDGRDDHERLYRDKQAARVEAVLCAAVTAYGLEKVLADIDLAECGVGKDWIEEWWRRHQENDAIRKRIKEASETHVLHAMIERAEDIEATVLALEAQVPARYETFAPPRPTASGIQTAYFGNVRVVMGWDVMAGKIVRRADLYYRKSLS